MPNLNLDRVYLVAEMANAHDGRVEDALGIVDAAARAGADAVKFQMFTPDEIAVPSFSYYDLYIKLQMPDEHWQAIVERAHGHGLTTICDVFGYDSLKRALRLGMDGFKVHNADVSNTPLLAAIGRTGKPVLLSTGGSKPEETERAIDVLRTSGASQIVLMHGFQSYPTRLSDSHLRRIETLRRTFDLSVGFAGHVDGGSEEAIQLPLWAVAAGADLIETHITLDRSKEGGDWFSSLDPEPFKEMVTAIRAAEPALGSRNIEMGADERAYRNKHKKWLVAVLDIGEGEEFTGTNLGLKRVDNVPADTYSTLDSVLGKHAVRAISQHEPIQPGDCK